MNWEDKLLAVADLLAIYDHYLVDYREDDLSMSFQDWLYKGLYWDDLEDRFAEALEEFRDYVNSEYSEEEYE